jgi:hypothetical protein
MSDSSCVLSINWGLPFGTLQSDDSDYLGPVKRLVPWGELPPGLELPKDMTWGEVLKELRRQDKTLPDLEADLKRSITNLSHWRWIGTQSLMCHWKYASLESGAKRALAQIFPGTDLKQVVDVFANATQAKPTTDFRPDNFEEAITNIHDSLLVETRTGMVGIAQRFQTHCSAKDCAKPRFKPGQMPIMDANGTWKHLTDDDNTYSPLFPFTNTCTSCPRTFNAGKSIFTTVNGGLPEHLYRGADGRAYTCSEAGEGEEGYYRRS